MLHLKTFGGISIDRENRQLPVRRHPLALLALLAAHGEQGMSRDKVVAYLWPESDAHRARNSLKQDCFALRRTLGQSVIASPAGTLRLDPTMLDVDVWRFEAALLAKQPAAAAALYQGPFLDGFYMPGLDEFERWSEAERARLAGLYAEVLESLAREADRTGDRPGAVAWWRRLTALDPFSSRAALGFARALVEAGDAPAALEHARRHATLVQEELGVPPPLEVAAFVERLGASVRAPNKRWAAPPASLPWPPPFRSPLTARRRATDGMPRLLGASRSRLRSAPPWLMAVLVSVVVLVAVGWDRWAARGAVPAGSITSATVAVLPFTSGGGGAVGGLGASLDELLASRLDGADRLRGVTISSRLDQELARAVRVDRQIGASIARRASARFYVLGRLIRTGDRLQATVTLYDRGNANTPAARAEASVEGLDLFELADRLAIQLVSNLFRGGDASLIRFGPVSTRSLPALKAYLEGERRFRADSFAPAVGAFRRAVRADTAFALAYYRLSLSAEQDGQDDLAQWAASMASRFSEDRPEHERRLVEAHLAYRRGRVTAAERLYRQAVAEAPDDGEAWLRLGELLFRANPDRGRSVTEARSALERGLALETENRQALVLLARIAVLDGRRAEADSLVHEAIAGAPDPPALAAWAFRTFVEASRAGDSELAGELLEGPRPVSPATLLSAAVNPEDLDGIKRLATQVVQEASSCTARAAARRMLSQLSMARGRPQEASAQLRDAGPCEPVQTLELRVAYASLPFLRPDSGELTRLRHALESGLATGREAWMEAAVGQLPTSVREYYLGLLALRVGDTLRARGAVLALTTSGDSSWALDGARRLRARLALAQGRPHRALALLERAEPWRNEAPLLKAGDRFLRAELLRELGREGEAIGWYRSIGERSLPELVYLAPAEARLAEIYKLRGGQVETLRWPTRRIR